MKYHVVEERYTYDLEIKVNNLIKMGWIPLGGISCSVGYGDCYGSTYAQAMIFGGEE